MRGLFTPFPRFWLSSTLLFAGLQACSQSAPSTPTPSSAGTGGAATGGATTGGAGSSAAGTASTIAGTGGQSGTAGSGGSAGEAAGGGGSGGTGGSSAGSGGAGGSAGAGGASADACGTAVYCDNFDAYTAPGNPGGNWVASGSYSGNMNGMVSVDTTHAYSGTNSVHFKTPGSTDFEHAFITLKGAPYFPVQDNILFGRMMIYVTQVPMNTAHWTLIEGMGSMIPGQPSLNEAVYRYGGQINGNQLMANYDTKPTSSDCAQRSTTKVPEGKWTCVEWRFDGKLKELDFWMDGTQNQALAVRQMANNTGTCQNKSWSGIWEPPTFNSIAVGFQHYQKTPGELWIDDFAIDTKKLGCPPVSATAK
jgi:hypothetical protein